jgi:hypothetical protein
VNVNGLDAVEKAKSEAATYAAGEQRPLGSYVLVMVAYAAVAAGLGPLVWRLRRPLAERLGWSDLVLTALGDAQDRSTSVQGPGDQLAQSPLQSVRRLVGRLSWWNRCATAVLARPLASS